MVKLAGHLNVALPLEERQEIFECVSEMYNVGALISSQATKDAMEQAVDALSIVLQTNCAPAVIGEATENVTGILVMLCHLCYNLGMLDTSREERNVVKNLFAKKESGNDVSTED